MLFTQILCHENDMQARRKPLQLSQIFYRGICMDARCIPYLQNTYKGRSFLLAAS